MQNLFFGGANMASFTTSGGVKVVGKERDLVAFLLQNAAGMPIKNYLVPVTEADSFEKSMPQEAKKLQKEFGEKEPLRLVRIHRCF